MMDKASLGNLDGVFCLPDVSSWLAHLWTGHPWRSEWCPRVLACPHRPSAGSLEGTENTKTQKLSTWCVKCVCLLCWEGRPYFPSDLDSNPWAYMVLGLPVFYPRTWISTASSLIRNIGPQKNDTKMKRGLADDYKGSTKPRLTGLSLLLYFNTARQVLPPSPFLPVAHLLQPQSC
jgi:hypothetical protein